MGAHPARPERLEVTERHAEEPESLIRDLRRTFRALADPERAAGARRYMKSAMPYYGIPAKPFRKACKEVFARHPLSGFEAWREASETMVVLLA